MSASMGADIIAASGQELANKPAWEQGRVQWRCGHYAFDAICEATHSIDTDNLAYWPEAKRRIDKLNMDGSAALARAKANWGKQDNMLWGIPVLCDENYHGLRLEPTGKRDYEERASA